MTLFSQIQVHIPHNIYNYLDSNYQTINKKQSKYSEIKIHNYDICSHLLTLANQDPVTHPMVKQVTSNLKDTQTQILNKIQILDNIQCIFDATKKLHPYLIIIFNPKIQYPKPSNLLLTHT